MTAMNVNLSVSSLALAGKISNLDVNSDNPFVSNKKSCVITIDWNLSGTLLDSWIAPTTGKWVINAFLEGWGSGTDEMMKGSDHASDLTFLKINGGSRTIVAATATDPTEWQYTETLTINAGELKPGPYRLALTITILDDAGKPGPIAGFVEYPDMVQVFEE